MMKHLQSIFCLGATAAATLAAATLSTQAQTWQTVYNSRSDGLSGIGSDIGTDPTGDFVFSTGRFIDETTGSSVAAVLKLDDAAGNWVPLGPLAGDGVSGAHYRGFAAFDPDHLLVGGHSNSAWIIRESTDGGASWSKADDFTPFGAGSGGSCADIKIHPSGDVYACGIGSEIGWVVRKRPAGGDSFIPVFEQSPSASESGGQAYQVGFHPNGDVFVVGGVVDSAGYSTWTVRRSADQGANWTTADSFRNAEWTGGSAQGIAITETGTIYVTGWAFYSSRKGSGYRWVVRASNDGLNWTISDNTAVGVSGAGVAVDAYGKPYVCGYGNGTWLVRALNEVTTIKKGKPVTIMTWNTIDQFQLAQGQEARANGIAIDPAGNLYVSGRAQDATGVDHWIVRRLAAAQ